MSRHLLVQAVLPRSDEEEAETDDAHFDSMASTQAGPLGERVHVVHVKGHADRGPSELLLAAAKYMGTTWIGGNMVPNL